MAIPKRVPSVTNTKYAYSEIIMEQHLGKPLFNRITTCRSDGQATRCMTITDRNANQKWDRKKDKISDCKVMFKEGKKTRSVGLDCGADDTKVAKKAVPEGLKFAKYLLDRIINGKPSIFKLGAKAINYHGCRLTPTQTKTCHLSVEFRNRDEVHIHTSLKRYVKHESKIFSPTATVPLPPDGKKSATQHVLRREISDK